MGTMTHEAVQGAARAARDAIAAPFAALAAQLAEGLRAAVREAAR